ncbi:MAG: hypothetical protein AAGH82_09785, partial [Pseudomonadota bacterium]
WLPRKRVVSMTARHWWSMMTDPQLRRAIVAEAVSWIGTPYSHQASVKQNGCDCLGLVRGIWRSVYGSEPEAAPPYAPDMDEAEDAGNLDRAVRRHLLSAKDPKPGSLLLLRWHPSMPAKHLGIVENVDGSGGPPVFVHAHSQLGVCRARLEGSWNRRLAGVFDFPAKCEFQPDNRKVR